MVGLEVAEIDCDVLPAHSEESADIDDDRGDLTVAVEDQILDAADLAVLDIINGALPIIFPARIWSGLIWVSAVAAAARAFDAVSACASGAVAISNVANAAAMCGVDTFSSFR
jgi:hypothetical protein